MHSYTYEISGTDANGASWTVRGVVTGLRAGQFQEAVGAAMHQAFFKLTRGEAEYGKPGVNCSGPYNVARLVIEGIPT